MKGLRLPNQSIHFRSPWLALLDIINEALGFLWALSYSLVIKYASHENTMGLGWKLIGKMLFGVD